MSIIFGLEYQPGRTNCMDKCEMYTLAIEQSNAALAEHSAPLVDECLRRGNFQVIMVSPRAEIEGLKEFHRNMGINSGVTYSSSEDIDFSNLNMDAMLTCKLNLPGPLFCNKGSPTNIPRIAMTHTLTDKKSVFPTYDPNYHPMSQFNVYFASGCAAFRGSWKRYVELNSSTLRTVKIFEIGSPKTDVLLRNVYDRTQVLQELGLDPAKKTVLYAPTFHREASLEQCGLDIIDIIREMDVNLLMRVHHVSLSTTRALAQRKGRRTGTEWRSLLEQIDSENPNVRFVEGDSSPYFVASDLLVGDISGACYEYMLQNKPVVFIDTPELFAEHGTGGISYWGRSSGDIISNLDDLAEIIQLNLTDPARKETDRLSLIDDLVYNPGHAAEVAVDTLMGLIEGRITYPKWGCRISRQQTAFRQSYLRAARKAVGAYKIGTRRLFRKNRLA